jgi:hypothetical protein
VSRAVREADGLVLVSHDAMRARRRPLAVGVFWCWESLLALALASAVASVARHAYGTHPDGDGPLFHAGALELLDLLVHSVAAAGPLLSLLLLVVAVAFIVGLIPSAMLMASIAFTTRDKRAPSLRKAIGRALGAFAPSAAVTLITGTLQVVFVGVGITMARIVAPAAVLSYGEPGGDKVAAAIALSALFVAMLVGVVGDVARAAVVRFEIGGVTALDLAWRLFGSFPLMLTWSYVWRLLASLAPIAIVAVVADKLGGLPGAALIALTVLHQLVIASRAAIRASWLALAMRALDYVGRS